MVTAFGGLSIGYSGLQAHQRALMVTGHNIANAGNEDYSRQQVVLTTTTPLGFNTPYGSGMYGTGVQVSLIKRITDVFIDNRLINENKSYGYWEKMQQLTHQLELIYNEPSENGIQSALDAFWRSLENLSNAEGQSEQSAARRLVIENANNLTGLINIVYEQLQELGGQGGFAGQQNAVDHEIATMVKSINQMAKEIAELNKGITAAVGAGKEPNDLLDRRDALIRQLSLLGNTTVTTSNSGETRVTFAGLVIAQGVNSYSIETRQDANGKLQLFHSENKLQVLPTDGALKALFDFRDNIVAHNIDSLNEFVITFTDIFNELHRTGFGLDGSTGNNFFEPLPEQKNGGIYKLRSNVYIPYPDKPFNGESSTTEPENFEKRLQRSSTLTVAASPFPFIDVTKSFANAEFTNKPDLNSKIMLTVNGETYLSDRLSAYSSVKEFIDKFNSNDIMLKNGIKLNYDDNNDKFVLTVANGNADVTIAEVDGMSTISSFNTINNGFWTSANINISTPMSYNNIADRAQINSNNDGIVDFRDSRLSINGYTIYYDGNVDSLNDIIQRINNTNCGAIAAVDATGRFTLTATKSTDYKILSIEDNGNLLSTLGILSQGKGYFGAISDERNIITSDVMREPIKNAAFAFKVSEEIKKNPNKVAATGGADNNLDGIPDTSFGPGDTSNAIKLANLRYNTYMNNRTNTFNDFYSSLISKVAVEAQGAKTNFETKEVLITNLKNLRQSVSGVSLDEEFANMIKFQQGYQASAKFVSAMNDMLNILMSVAR